MSTHHSLRKYLLVGLILVFSQCGNEDPEIQIIPEVLEEFQLLTSKSQQEITDFIKGTGLPLPSSEIKSGVEIYKITYLTELNGQSITASGLVILPTSQEPVGMLSFQHGTIVAHDEAPSETPVTSNILMFYAAMSAPGLIGIVPDFIGFGSSKNVVHPYYLEKPTADAVIDNLRAGRELALLNKLNFNGRLFLAGYSQGGYATMAAHKSIEENGLEDFTLIASFPSSGGYDIKGVQEYFFEQDYYDQPFYLAFVAFAYRTTLGWTQPLTDFFQQPYADAIPGLLNGTYSGGEINAQLTSDIQQLVSPHILANINSDTKYDYINNAFAENSLTDWTPKIKMYMYHGDFDVTVPYQNSVDVYQKFIARGASPDVVKFTTLPFANHGSGVTPYLIAFINQLLLLK